MTKPLTSKKLFERMTGCIPKSDDHYKLRVLLSKWDNLGDNVVLDDHARNSIYYNVIEKCIVSPYDTWEIELIQLFIGDWIAYNSMQTKELRSKFMKLEKIKLGLIEGLQGS